MPPPRPAGGGGRPTPPRQPARQQPARQQPRAQPAAPRGTDPRMQRAEQQRRAAEQQRRADQQRRGQQQRGQQQRRATTRATQQRLRNQQYLREAHGARREDEAAQRTAAIEQRIAELESILATGLQRSARIDLVALADAPAAEPAFDPGPLAEPAPEPQREEFALTGPARWGSRYRREQREAAARTAYQQARERWQAAEQERAGQLAAAEEAHQQRLAQARADADAYQDRIARVAAGLRDRAPAVVESFLRTVLRRVPLPAGFPRRAEVHHHPAGEQVTLRLVLPGREVVPEVAGYEYAAPADEIRPVPWPDEATVDDRYDSVVAQVALLVVRDVLEAEPALAGVDVEGLIDETDPDTGEPALACLVRFSAGRAEFAALDLAGEPPAECLDRLAPVYWPDPVGATHP